MVPLRADQLYDVDARSICLLGAIEIIALRVDAGEQRADSGQLVAADPPVDDGLSPRLRVEGPTPIVFEERDRQRQLFAPTPSSARPGPLRSIASFSSQRAMKRSCSSRSAYRSPESMIQSPSGPRIARNSVSLPSRKAVTNAVTASSGDAKPRCAVRVRSLPSLARRRARASPRRSSKFGCSALSSGIS
jgi:hypothetical protein